MTTSQSPAIVYAGLDESGSLTVDSPFFSMALVMGNKKRNPQTSTLRKCGESRSTAFLPSLDLRSVSKSEYSTNSHPVKVNSRKDLDSCCD